MNTIYIHNNLSLRYAMINSGNSPETVFTKVAESHNTAYYQSTIQGIESGDRALFLFSGVLKIIFSLGFKFAEAFSDLRQGLSGKVEVCVVTLGAPQPKEYSMSDFIIYGVESSSNEPAINFYRSSFFSAAFWSHEAVCKAILARDTYVFHKIDPSLQKNEDFALYALSKGVSYSVLPTELKEKEDFALRALQKKCGVSLN